ARFGEGVRELLVGIERLRFELLQVIGDDGVWNVIAIGPGKSGTDGDRDRGGRETEVVDRNVTRRHGIVRRGNGEWGVGASLRVGQSNKSSCCESDGSKNHYCDSAVHAVFLFQPPSGESMIVRECFPR